MRIHSTDSGRQSEKLASARRRSPAAERPLYLFGAAIAGAAAVIGLVVLLTPLEPIDPLDPASSAKTDAASGAPQGTAASAQPGGAGLPAAVAAAAPRTLKPPRKISWPSDPVELTVDSLQQELKELGVALREQFPERADALHVSAMISKELGQSAEAETLWRRSTELAPPEVGPYVGLATVMMERGEDAAAVEVLLKAHADGRRSAESYRQMAVGQGKLGEVEAAAATLKEGLASYPSDGGLWLEQAQVQLQLRQLDQAETAVRRALELGEHSESAIATLATVLARNRKTDEAAKVRAALAEAKPKERNGDAFQDTYLTALRSVAVNCLQLASTIWNRAGDPDKAEALLMRAIAVAPEELLTYMELAALYRSQQRIADALQVHERLVELQPGNALNYVNLASIASQLGNLPLAEQALVRGTQVKPDYAFLYGELAKLHLLKQEFEQALQRAEQAREREPKNIEWLLMKAAAAKGSGDNQQAQAAFDAARRLAPDDPRLKNMLAAIPEFGQATP